MRMTFREYRIGLIAIWLFLPSVALAQAPSKPKTDHKDYSEAMKGTEAKFDMVAIPAGEFVMGSPETEKGRKKNEGPQHKVKISAFWMGKCAVTWNEFLPFQRTLLEQEDTGKKPEFDAVTYPTRPYVPADYGHGYGNKPAICMTHHCANEYCRWLSFKTGKTYRLPTEAEWEYACRAGTTTAYSFGDDPTKLEDYAWTKKNSPETEHEEGTTHDVGTRKPNPWGLYDMHGNVMQWTMDQYDKAAYAKYAKNPFSVNPLAMPTADKWAHVARGGCWKDEDPAAFRSACRQRSHPDWMKSDPQEPRSIWWLTKFDRIGFRVVVAVEEKKELKDFVSKVTKQSKDELDDEDEDDGK